MSTTSKIITTGACLIFTGSVYGMFLDAHAPWEAYGLLAGVLAILVALVID